MSAVSLRPLFDAGRLWQGASNLDIPTHSTGFGALDTALSGGGWPAHMLIELLTDCPASLPIQCILPCWQHHQDTRWVALINPPATPSAEGLQQNGLNPERVDVIDAGKDTAWTLEQLSRSPVIHSILAWSLTSWSHTQLRRLQLACQQSETQLFLVREPGCVQQPSPAPVRVQLMQHQRHLAIEILKQPGRQTCQRVHVPVHAPWTDAPPPRTRQTTQPQQIGVTH
jgi:cell division inhibitor SulA